MIRILNAEPDNYSDTAREILRSIGEVDEKRLSRTELIAALPDYDVLITRFGVRIDREVIDAGRRLKIIASPVTGLDHIDVEYALARGIQVISLKGETAFLEGVPATAEHTWALLLALVRNIPEAYASVRQGLWDRDRFRGRELQGKTLGIVGLGRIGRKVARYGSAFEMKVVAHDPYNLAFPPQVERRESLLSLLGDADVVCLHVPLSGETEGLIGPGEFRAMKSGAILVNTSRGRVIDETALIHALESGRLGGAALDVVCEGSRLPELARTNSKLVITPHLGGATFESMQKTEVFIATRLKAVLV